jgi:hypothetical protein
VIINVDSALGVSNHAKVAERVVNQCRETALLRWGIDVTDWASEVWLSRLFAKAKFARTDGGTLVFKIVSYDPDTGEISQLQWELH